MSMQRIKTDGRHFMLLLCAGTQRLARVSLLWAPRSIQGRSTGARPCTWRRDGVEQKRLNACWNSARIRVLPTWLFQRRIMHFLWQHLSAREAGWTRELLLIVLWVQDGLTPYNHAWFYADKSGGEDMNTTLSLLRQALADTHSSQDVQDNSSTIQVEPTWR